MYIHIITTNIFYFVLFLEKLLEVNIIIATYVII